MPLEPTTFRPSFRHHAIADGWSEDVLTARTRTIWSGPDFLPIARSFEGGAQEFVRRLGLQPGERVLDVACGTGNLAIPAAREGARVSGVDIAPNLIATARREAERAGVEVAFEVGDAESLPYPDGRFDTVVSMFGAMFAPHPERAADELLRVTRSGGRIVMANWTPGGLIGDLLRAHTAVALPPAGLASPLLWGDDAAVRARFAGRYASLTCTPREIELRFALPPEGVTELFATNYGPTVTALKVIAPEDRHRLRESLTALWRAANRSTMGNTVVVGEYLEVVLEKV